MPEKMHMRAWGTEIQGCRLGSWNRSLAGRSPAMNDVNDDVNDGETSTK